MYISDLDVAICDTCGKNADVCICPECPVCHETGNRFCYDEGYLTYTYDQLVGQALLDVIKAEGMLAMAKEHLQWLQEKGSDV